MHACMVARALVDVTHISKMVYPVMIRASPYCCWATLSKKWLGSSKCVCYVYSYPGCSLFKIEGVGGGHVYFTSGRCREMVVVGGETRHSKPTVWFAMLY